MVANCAAENDHVAWPGPVAADLHAHGYHTDPRRVDEQSVGLAVIHYLRIPGHDLHARSLSGGGHGSDHSLQVGQFQPLFEDEPGAEVERRGPAHRQVVDRAAHGQLADVAAGEENGADDVRIGGEGKAKVCKSASRQIAHRPTCPLAHLYHRRVVHPSQNGVVEIL